MNMSLQTKEEVRTIWSYNNLSRIMIILHLLNNDGPLTPYRISKEIYGENSKTTWHQPTGHTDAIRHYLEQLEKEKLVEPKVIQGYRGISYDITQEGKNFLSSKKKIISNL
jgi:DNA-binding PadR family transcriptional regulator